MAPNRLSNHAEFISRFLYKEADDEGSPDAPPSPEAIKKAAATAKDIIGFDAYRASFVTLAEIIDACIAEEIALDWTGLAASNARNHPRVMALKELDPAVRAGVALASAQGLLWMENCRRWVEDTAYRNQIAMRLMTAILYSAGRTKGDYTADQLAALAKIGASLRGMDLFVISARNTIKEVVGKKAKKAR